MNSIDSENISNVSQEHPFQPVHPDTRPQSSDTVRNIMILQSETVYKKGKDNLVLSEGKDQGPTSLQRTVKKKSTIISSGLIMANACLGTTIFTFAIKAKTFGLVWLLVAATVVGLLIIGQLWQGPKQAQDAN